MTDLTLYGFAPSTYTRTARMVCAESGAAHMLEPLEFKEASHLALHPFGKMPAMRHGDLRLFETLAIAVYIDTAFGGSCQPGTPLERARMLQWISAAMDNVYPIAVAALAEAQQGDREVLSAARAALAPFEQALSGTPYVDSAALTLADLFLFPMVDFAIAVAGTDLLAGYAHLPRWHDRIGQRRSSQETTP